MGKRQRDMGRWIAWADKRMAQLVVGEKLHVRLLGVVQGPLTVTFRLRLVRPSAGALRRLLGLGPALAQALQVDGVRVTDTAQGVLVEVPSPLPRTPSAGLLARHTRPWQVAVGLDQWRKPVRVDLRHHPTLLFVGPSRRGKTQAMKSVLYALARSHPPRRLQFLIVAQKLQDWRAFQRGEHCLGVLSDPEEAAQALAWLAGVKLQERASSGAKEPALVVVLDDLLNLLKRADVSGPIGELASMGGGVGIYQLIGTQDAGSKRGTGGADVEANITARVVYRAASATTAARAAGAGKLGVEHLSGHKGDALLVLDGVASRIATAQADDRDILQLPRQADNFVVSQPWRGATAHNRLQPPETAHNRLQPVATTPHEGATGAVARGDGPQPVAQPVGATGPVFPIERRPPTPEEARAIAEMARQGRSLSAICRTVYGSKDGRTFAWVKAAAGGGDQGGDGTIDLTTEQGRAALEALRSRGLVQWRDVSELLQ